MPAKFEFSGNAKTYRSEVFAEKMVLFYDSDSENKLTINTFYFPNWQAFINGKEAKIKMDKEGRIQLVAPPGRHKVDLRFGYLQIEKIANLLSLAGLLILVGEIIWMRGELKLRKI